MNEISNTTFWRFGILSSRLANCVKCIFFRRSSPQCQASLLLMIFLVFGLNGVKAQVTSDYDRDADFYAFKTYTFMGWSKGSDSQLNDLDKRRVEQAFKEELSARGLELNDQNADVAITLFLVVDEKTSTTAYTNYTGGMGMGSSTTTYNQNDYQVGTLVIDCYDDNTKKLVWQGTITKTLSNPKKRDKRIPKAVAQLMKKYPIQPSE